MRPGEYVRGDCRVGHNRAPSLLALSGAPSLLVPWAAELDLGNRQCRLAVHVRQYLEDCYGRRLRRKIVIANCGHSEE